MKLTPAQEDAYLSLIMFAMSDHKETILNGPGGAGKGVLMQHIHDNRKAWREDCSLMSEYKYTNPIFLATTNEAASVLKSRGIDSMTIHSYAGIRPDFSNSPNKYAFNRFRSSTSPFMLFIDEASMVDKDLYDAIHKQLPNAKIVWVMDTAQLAAVGSKKPFIDTIGLSEVSLTAVIRSQGPLQQLNTYLRDCVLAGDNALITDYHNGNDIVLVDGPEFQRRIVEAFSSLTWDRSTARILSFHRDRTAQYNDYVHCSVKGFTEYFAVGAMLRQSGYSTSLRDGEVVEINHVCIENEVAPCGTEYQMLRINHMHRQALNPKLFKSLATKHKWRQANDVSALVNLTHTYANTVHVAQGSTIETVFVDLIDIQQSYNSCREMYRRLFYSAVSRASKQVVIRTSQC